MYTLEWLGTSKSKIQFKIPASTIKSSKHNSPPWHAQYEMKLTNSLVLKYMCIPRQFNAYQCTKVGQKIPWMKDPRLVFTGWTKHPTQI